jgi:outer membrane lipoprotein LolB
MTGFLARRRRFAGFAAGLAMLALGACAGLKPAADTAGPVQESFGGRFSVRYAEGEAQKGLQGNFRWLESAGATQLELSSPLGAILARMTVDAQGAALTTSDGETRHADDVDALAEQGLGWRLPVSGLRHWLRGQLAPPAQGRATGRLERGPDGKPALIEQDGWRIQYQDYVRTSAGTDRPGRLVVEYGGQGSASVSLRLALRYE